MSEKNYNKCVALVLGGHVNGYSIIKELYNNDIENIALFDYGKSIAKFSNKINYYSKIDLNSQSLLTEIQKIHTLYSYIVIYPTDDLQLENLLQIYDSIKSFCYIPLNPKNLADSMDKAYQYKVCNEIGIPFPKTISIKANEDIEKIKDLTFPLIIKPSKREDLSVEVFRNLYVENPQELIKNKSLITSHLLKGIELIVSEYIPGDDTNIYAYTCFRSNSGEILNSWIGKKLTQYPDNYGVFSSSSNQAPSIVAEQSAVLIEAIDAFGIIEPEFKYDSRDGKYKLMEINLRSMMWNGTGSASGVFLHKTQFNYATNQPITKYRQNSSDKIHYVLMLHEIPNLIARKNYFKHFIENVFGGKKRVWAIFDHHDIKPFIRSLPLLTKAGVSACQRRLKIK